MAFHVLFVASDLSDRDRVGAVAAGPSYVSASASYPDLLASAGFGDIDELDLTDQYRLTAAAFLHESARAAKQLEEIFGIEEFRLAQQEREDTLAAIEGGLLRRSLFVAQASQHPQTHSASKERRAVRDASAPREPSHRSGR